MDLGVGDIDTVDRDLGRVTRTVSRGTAAPRAAETGSVSQFYFFPPFTLPFFGSASCGNTTCDPYNRSVSIPDCRKGGMVSYLRYIL